MHGRIGVMGAAIAVAAALVLPAAAQAATPLDDAPVPSLCEHPAGQLVDGRLPGIPANRGGVYLAQLYRKGMIAAGKVRGKGDRAAVVACNQGGVGWPDNIVVYDKRKRIVGTVRLFDVTKGGRETVQRLSIRRGTVHADVVNIAQDGDADCCGSRSAHLKIRWDAARKQIRVTGKTFYSERKPVQRLLRAVNRGKRRAALRFASAEIVDSFLAVRRMGARITFGDCYGILADEWWVDLYGSTGWTRSCTTGVDWDDPSQADVDEAVLLRLNRRGLHGYRATGSEPLTG